MGADVRRNNTLPREHVREREPHVRSDSYPGDGGASTANASNFNAISARLVSAFETQKRWCSGTTIRWMHWNHWILPQSLVDGRLYLERRILDRPCNHLLFPVQQVSLEDSIAGMTRTQTRELQEIKNELSAIRRLLISVLFHVLPGEARSDAVSKYT